MAVLHGRQDTMLDGGRFFRFLRQAHDAEVADVRKLGEDDYEVIGRRTESGPIASPGATGPVTAADGTEEQLGLGAIAEPASLRGGMRFRRGSRLGSATQVIPMIGVVNMEEDAPAPEPGKKARAPRKKAATAPAAEPVEAEAGPPKKKRAARTKKKPAE
jgi:hypothetical protein